MTYKKILVPVDGSQTSQAGLKEAISLAKTQGAKLRILHVIDVAPILNIPEGGVDFGLLEDEVKRAGKEIIDAAVSAATKQGVRAEIAMPESLGEPAAEIIIDEALRWKADLIVIGTHGRSGLKRILLGSVAELVVRSAQAPVLLVHGHPQPAKKRATRRTK